MAMFGLNEAHVARPHVSPIRPIKHGAVLKAETCLIVRRLKQQVGVISMTGIRLDSNETLSRIHVLVENIGIYIDLSEGWTRLRLSISVPSLRRTLFVPLHSFPCLRSHLQGE